MKNNLAAFILTISNPHLQFLNLLKLEWISLRQEGRLVIARINFNLAAKNTLGFNVWLDGSPMKLVVYFSNQVACISYIRSFSFSSFFFDRGSPNSCISDSFLILLPDSPFHESIHILFEGNIRFPCNHL